MILPVFSKLSVILRLKKTSAKIDNVSYIKYGQDNNFLLENGATCGDKNIPSIWNSVHRQKSILHIIKQKKIVLVYLLCFSTILSLFYWFILYDKIEYQLMLNHDI